jgi:RNA-binding protein
MTDPISSPPAGPLLRTLKARGQLLEPTVLVGKAGLSAEFHRNLAAEFELRELVKVKFTAFKEQKKELVKQLVADSGSHLVMRVGNVAVLYREHPDPAKRKFATA